MQTNNFKIIAFVLLLITGCFSSCSEKKDEPSGNVPYKPCPCGNDNKPLVTIRGDIRLFIDSVTKDDVITFSERLIYISNDDYAGIVLNSDNPNLFKLGSVNGGTEFHICNFPDFAKQWHTPGGITVSYKGLVYPNCGKFGCRDLCYNLILTNLEITPQ